MGSDYFSVPIFFIVFRDLDRKEIELNAIGKGDRAGFADEVATMQPST